MPKKYKKNSQTGGRRVTHSLSIYIYIYNPTHELRHLFCKFAGPWPRACQILGFWKTKHQQSTSTSTSKIVSTLSASTCALVFNNQEFSTIHSVQVSNLVSFLHHIWVQALFSARISNNASTAAPTIVSCLYSAHARLPLREPPGLWIEWCLSLEGHLFLKQFLEHLFSH